LCCTLLWACSTGIAADDSQHIGDQQFQNLMNQVSEGWNRNDATYAANAFAEGAIYSEPPDKQLYAGKKKIWEFFGGATGRNSAMHMQWHHLSFNEKTQIGAGEFTFSWPDGQVHGMVSIKIDNGLIKNWREYFYESNKDWEQFQGSNRF